MLPPLPWTEAGHCAREGMTCTPQQLNASKTHPVSEQSHTSQCTTNMHLTLSAHATCTSFMPESGPSTCKAVPLHLRLQPELQSGRLCGTTATRSMCGYRYTTASLCCTGQDLQSPGNMRQPATYSSAAFSYTQPQQCCLGKD